MSNRSFLICVSILALLIIGFPLWQIFTNSGLLLYTNGIDEVFYLQYDYAKKTFWHHKRFSEIFVIILQEQGLSGSWINFIFDLLIPCSSILLLKKVLERMGLPHPKSLTLLCILVPTLFLSINPIAGYTIDVIHQSFLLKWVTLPALRTHPLLRTPEPQFSYLVMLLATLTSLKRRNFIYAYLALPFLYSFVALPYVFTLVNLHAYKRLSFAEKYHIMFIVLSWLLLGTGLHIFVNYLVSEETRGHLVATHLPLISITGIVSIILYATLRKRIPRELQFFSLLMGVTPILTNNLQCISGWVMQPNNFEQYVNVFCIGFLCCFIPAKTLLHRTLLAGSFFMFLLSSVSSFKGNMKVDSDILKNKNILSLLEDKDSNLLFTDTYKNHAISLIFPRQKQHPFNYAKAFLGGANTNREKYLCEKKALSHTDDINHFAEVLRRLDAIYACEGRDYFLNTIGRKACEAPTRLSASELCEIDFTKYIVVNQDLRPSSLVVP